MINEEQLQNASGVISTAQTILVMFTEDPSIDELATATSLFLSLEKMGKTVMLLSPEFEADEQKNFAGVDRVTSKLGHKNLNIIFDYHPEAIDKVSYHINEEANKFYLVIQPQKGHAPLDAKSVTFDYAGAEADLILLVGISELEELDHLYFGYEQLFQDSATISIAPFESKIANINLDTSGSSSMSEDVVDLIEACGGEIDPDIATNLLAGIEDRTDSFHSLSSSPLTFEKAAKLLKAGARRIHRAKMESVSLKMPIKRDTQQLVDVMRNQGKSVVIAKKTGDKIDQKPIEAKTTKVQPKPVIEEKLKKTDRGKPGELGYTPGFGPGGNG